MNSLNRYLTHNLRNIPRIILVLLIVAAFGMYLSTIKIAKVKGVKTQNINREENEFLKREIERTIKVTQERPDYAGAWLRLSILYERIGETDKANEARITAQRFNPDK